MTITSMDVIVKKREKMLSDDVISRAEGGEWDGAGGH